MKDQCLHCVLMAAAREWMSRNSRADSEALIDMCARFYAELVSEQPEYQGIPISILIMGFKSEVDKRKMN